MTMGLFRVFSYSSKAQTAVVVDDKAGPPVDHQVLPASGENSELTVADITEQSPSLEFDSELAVPPQAIALPLSPVTSGDGEQPKRKRRISLRPFTRPRVHEQHKQALSKIEEQQKMHEVAAALTKSHVVSSSSDRKAKESALAVRALIVGSSSASPMVTRAFAKPKLSKIKSQLMKPKSANRVIAHLRQLSVEDVNARDARVSYGPIHAVCLDHTDAQEHDLHFAHLCSPDHDHSDPAMFPSVSSSPMDKLSDVLNKVHIVDLVASDFGIGQPGDGAGLLAGAVPTAETVINGIQQITPQLLALGYATGKAITPDHTGIYPPIDRMSVLTYWWGLEIALPPPTLEYLGTVHSISGTVVNFLSALSLVNNGVREILPFVRYISQFIDFEFNAIKSQNKGYGVVCAATWLMPAAMVPRPWDFSSPPASLLKPAKLDANLKLNDALPLPNVIEVEPIPDESSGSLEPPVAQEPIATPPSLPTSPPGEVNVEPALVPLPVIGSPASQNGGRHAPSLPIA